MTNLGYTPEEPIAAISTALAPGAIGIVRCSGKDCIQNVTKIFSRPKALLEAQGNTLVYGWIIDSNKNKIDEVMLGVYKDGKSFTGEEMVEIFCHGGVNVVTTILRLLLENGFRQAQRGEFTFRAYINGKTDLTKAEAIREIIDSKTNESRSHAASRLSGSLFEEIDIIKKDIIDTLASIEVEIEYPEDEETISETFDAEKLKACQKSLKNLVDSWKSEKLYQDGARVVLCGKTNAGKSSLFNSLLKEERAIVSDIEGTTRDWLESWVSFDGIPARLFDTAGLRKTDDVIEARGVELTKDLSNEADIVLYLIDSSVGIVAADEQFIKAQTQNPVVLVLNKCDKVEMLDESKYQDLTPYIVKISAKKGDGIGNLTSLVKQILTEKINSTQESGHTTTGLGSERQKEAVQEALERVDHALEIVETQELGLDAVVQDLEDCLDNLGEVTGSVTPEDVLGSIFANFCVGK